jgi:hypothetical protein
MLSSHRNKIVAVVAALVLVVGAGAAVGATGVLSPKEESEALLNDVADQLGVEPSELTDALKTALKNRVDEAVADGRLTEAQAREIKERIDAGDVPFFGFGLGGGPMLHHHGPGPLGGFDAAADYLGVTEEQLRDALADGESLADVAKSEGKTVDGLVDALVADAKEKLAQAVEDGRLTQAQRNAIQEDLEDRIRDFVNRDLPARPWREPGAGMVPEPEPSVDGVTA